MTTGEKIAELKRRNSLTLSRSFGVMGYEPHEFTSGLKWQENYAEYLAFAANHAVEIIDDLIAQRDACQRLLKTTFDRVVAQDVALTTKQKQVDALLAAAKAVVALHTEPFTCEDCEEEETLCAKHLEMEQRVMVQLRSAIEEAER